MSQYPGSSPNRSLSIKSIWVLLYLLVLLSLSNLKLRCFVERSPDSVGEWNQDISLEFCLSGATMISEKEAIAIAVFPLLGLFVSFTSMISLDRTAKCHTDDRIERLKQLWAWVGGCHFVPRIAQHLMSLVFLFALENFVRCPSWSAIGILVRSSSYWHINGESLDVGMYFTCGVVRPDNKPGSSLTRGRLTHSNRI